MRNGKKIAALLMVFTMVFSTLLPVHAQDIIPEASDIGQDIGTRWQGSIQNGTLCYVSDEGEKLTGLQEIDGQLYYFDDEGNAQTGWVEINGSLYYFALENGQAYRNTVQMIDGVEYEFSPEGIATEKIQDAENSNDETELENPDKEDIQENDVSDDNHQSVNTPEPEEGQDSTDTDVTVDEQQEETAEDTTTSGWKTANGIMKYYSTSGEYLTGKCKVGGNWYYFDENGACLKGQWITDGDKKYYAMSDGMLRIGWLSFGSTYYYCNSNAEIVTGKQKIGNSWYYFNEEGVRQQGKWITDGDKKYYAMPDGTLRVGWLSFGSTYYYCNSNAEIVTGWQTINGSGYYFNENGVRQNNQTGWKTEGDKTYYIMPDGTARIGWLSFGSTYYYCGSDGAIVYGKQKIGSSWYYFNEKGVRQQGKWITDGDKKYYAMPEGTLRVGWLSFGSTYYYCNSNAEIVTGIYVVDGVGYQFDENGIRRKAETGWYEDEATGNRYYVMPDGTYRVGWLSFGSTHYYCGSNGAIVYGKQKIDGKWYYFNEEGVRQSSAWYEDADGRYYMMPDGSFRTGWLSFGSTYYYCGSNGAIVYGKQKISGSWYYFNDKGIRQTSTWITNGDEKYYAMPDGTLRVGWLSFGSTYYYCGSDAAIICGIEYPIGGVLYSFNWNGVMQKEGGWGSYNGHRYYKNPSTGFPYTGWVSFGSTQYYADSSGFMVSGWQTIGGYRYYFDPDTNIMARNTMIDGIYLGSDGKASEAYTYASSILNQVGWSLRAAYDWCIGLKYIHMTEDPSPGSEWFALYGYKNGRGNCYVMAGTFYCMAKLMGYDAHQISGYVMSVGGNSPHSWVEINIGGTIYVFDVCVDTQF